jgi:hypothetical protein
MTMEERIHAYIAGQPEPKRGGMRALHRRILRLAPGCRLWFLDGRDESGKIVSSPNIGYGLQTLKYAGGKTRDFYRIGLGANTKGISVYILGVKDKAHLARTYGARLGKAKVTGYCIGFGTLDEIDGDALEEAIRFGLEARDDECGAG